MSNFYNYLIAFGVTVAIIAIIIGVFVFMSYLGPYGISIFLAFIAFAGLYVMVLGVIQNRF